MKKKLFLVLVVCLLGCFVSSAFAASTFKRVSVNPFYRPPLTSEADLRALVKSRNTQIRTGFAKAGYPDLYPAFSEQFPSATIDSIKVSPGETFKWMLFRKKGSGPVIVTNTVDIGICHQHDLVIARLGQIEVLADAGAEARDKGLDLVVGQNLVDPGLLDVDDLAPERQDRLVVGVATSSSTSSPYLAKFCR